MINHCGGRGPARRGYRTQAQGFNDFLTSSSGAFMKFGRSAATGFNVMALPVRYSNQRKSDFRSLDQSETAPYYEYIISSFEA
jgi:hypothetical protein